MLRVPTLLVCVPRLPLLSLSTANNLLSSAKSFASSTCPPSTPSYHSFPIVSPGANTPIIYSLFEVAYEVPLPIGSQMHQACSSPKIPSPPPFFSFLFLASSGSGLLSVSADLVLVVL
ncbi:hypothetical protein K435DRAFT_853118 [Dendrothele bispora CBS 962.96]|uniref:Uncharacterized protein n=1 Tax=Dendrothele bispora (strain CBS 962.96) TaxID=1314807 RepID=A0A4S8MIU9_DENBC|nr:hypothetical protein K435DRAFT_853118 [Dendrothele bispora CBS 962.96]